jgi:hypothetical protein
LFYWAFEVIDKPFLTAKGFRYYLKVDKLLLFAIHKGTEEMVRLGLWDHLASKPNAVSGSIFSADFVLDYLA